jgi:hypothetical protein
MKTGFSIAGVIIALFLLIWIVQGNDFFMFKVFAPKYEEVRRETYEQSTAYIQGTIQELERLQVEYETAPNTSNKETIANMIIKRASGFPEDRMPERLKIFINKLRDNRVEKRKEINQ